MYLLKIKPNLRLGLPLSLISFISLILLIASCSEKETAWRVHKVSKVYKDANRNFYDDNKTLFYSYNYGKDIGEWMVSNSIAGCAKFMNGLENDKDFMNGYYYEHDSNISNSCRAASSNACPSGWSIPSKDQWNKLISWLYKNDKEPAARWWNDYYNRAYANYYSDGWGQYARLIVVDGAWFTAEGDCYVHIRWGDECPKFMPFDSAVGLYAMTVRCIKN